METIKEFIYTASPWGNSDPGWMVFATSPGFETGLVDQCRDWFHYRVPEGMSGNPSEEELANYPVQYVVARPFGDNRVLVSQTVFIGQRWYDPRPGDWFAHALVVPGEQPLNSSSGQSPFRWYRSPSLVTRYKEEWKEKAKAISQRIIPWEKPPVLPEPESIDEIDANSHFRWHCLLGRISKDAWAKIGALLAMCVNREAGRRGLVFDARMAESLDTMAALLELLPMRMRLEAQFATYLHADNVRDTKAEETFLFYGMVRPGEEGDAETGVYGVVPGGGVAFAGREDAEAFKEMVDACGEGLGAGDWDGLVRCWEAATGKRRGAGAVREAMEYAKAREGTAPGLRAAVERGLANAFGDVLSGGVQNAGAEDREACLVAWFEFRLEGFRRFGAESADLAAGDASWLGAGWDALPSARKQWLESVLASAKARGYDGLVALTNTWLAWRRGGAALPGTVALPKEYAVMEGYRDARDAVASGQTGGEVRWKQQAEDLWRLCGQSISGVAGFAQTYGTLVYRVLVATLQTQRRKGVPDFFKGVRELERQWGLEVPKQQQEADAARCLDAGKLGATEILEVVRLFQQNGLSPALVVRSMEDNPTSFLALDAKGMLDGLVAFRDAGLPWEGLFRKVCGQGAKFAGLGGAKLLEVLKDYQGANFDAGRLLDAALKTACEEGRAQGRMEAEREGAEIRAQLERDLGKANRKLNKSVAEWAVVLYMLLAALLGAGGMWLGERIAKWVSGGSEGKKEAPAEARTERAENRKMEVAEKTDGQKSKEEALSGQRNELVGEEWKTNIQAQLNDLIEIAGKIPMDEGGKLAKAQRLVQAVEGYLKAGNQAGCKNVLNKLEELLSDGETVGGGEDGARTVGKLGGASNSNPGDKQKGNGESQIWIEGTKHPQHPHVRAGKERGKWVPEPGYKARAAGDLDPVWTPGVKYPGNPHVFAAEREGTWNKDVGWEWAHLGTDDLSVKWVPGARDPYHPNIHASETEGQWAPDFGYKWASSGAKGDLSVMKTGGQ